MYGLTRDNLLLSSPKNPDNPAAGPFAVDCKTAPERIADFVRESLAPNTRAAYLADLAHFENWGGQIPAEPETVAAYLCSVAPAAINEPRSTVVRIATGRDRP